MAVITPIVIIPAKNLELTSPVLQYTATTRVIIDSASVVNAVSSGSRFVRIYIIPGGGVAGQTNLMFIKNIQARTGYNCINLLGITLEIGDEIWAYSSGSEVQIQMAGRSWVP